jgi:hypothetical protein
MQPQLPPSAISLLRGTVASWTCAALLSAFALSVLPHWHELLHSDATNAQHECVVTLVSSGTHHHPAPAPLVAAPVPALQVSFVPALHPVWVATPFVGARIFEHAPPAFA